jgi:hypothetical protein
LRSVGRDLSDFVFPSRAVDGHIQGLESALGIASKAIGHDLTLHDLRRSCRSVAEAAGVTEFQRRRLLNHLVTGDVDLAYVQLSDAAMPEAAERVGEVMAKLCAVEASKPEQAARKRVALVEAVDPFRVLARPSTVKNCLMNFSIFGSRPCPAWICRARSAGP